MDAKKVSAVIFGISGILGLSANAKDVEVVQSAQIVLCADKPQNLLDAAELVSVYASQDENSHIKVVYDKNMSSANIKFKVPKSGTRLDDLLGELKTKYGHDIKIDKIKIDEMISGTQDDQMH